LGRRTPGHNSLSHLVCSLSKVSARHVVRRPRCSRTLAVAICASRSHQCTRASATRREARRFIHAFNRSSWGCSFCGGCSSPTGRGDLSMGHSL
jgi:hypothetical protein